MYIKCFNGKGEIIELHKKEKEAYVDYIQKKNPDQNIEYIIIKLDGEYVDLEYKTTPTKFQRIRRITGYLTGDINTWNNAKKHELKDRIKHC